MFKKTTSVQCAAYCEIIRTWPDLDCTVWIEERVPVSDKGCHTLISSDQGTYLSVTHGVVGILFETEDGVQLFVIHRHLLIRPGIAYALIALSNSATVRKRRAKGAIETLRSIPPYTHHPLVPTFKVTEILAFYYSTKGQRYLFEGERTPYWELTYVDHGELITEVDGQRHTLPAQTLFFYSPNQFHNQSTGPQQTCSYMTLMFQLRLDDPQRLEHRVIRATPAMLDALRRFMLWGADDQIQRVDLLIATLAQVIALVLEDRDVLPLQDSLNPMQQHVEDELLSEITHYVTNHIEESLTIARLCTKFGISRSSLQTLFKHHLNTSPKAYINQRKLDQSKLLLKHGALSVGEVSDRLGFASIHYFSRTFKRHFGMTPSAYAKSILN